MEREEVGAEGKLWEDRKLFLKLIILWTVCVSVIIELEIGLEKREGGMNKSLLHLQQFFLLNRANSKSLKSELQALCYITLPSVGGNP